MCFAMLTFDVAMPIMLFGVTLAALLLSKRVEPKLKTTFEEREFRARDAVLFVVLIAVAVSIVVFFSEMALMFYGGLAALGLAAFAFIAILYEQTKPDVKSRLYLAVFPPVLFLIVFFLYMYEPVPLLSLVLVDVSGALFAVLITIYLASLFTWRITFIFASLLTVMDIILVLFTGVMVTAATHVAGLGLPVLISLPTIPLVLTTRGIRFLSRGVGA